MKILKLAEYQRSFNMKCHYTLEECVSRLSEKIVSPAFIGETFDSTVIGMVNKDYIKLYYFEPLTRKFWLPHFEGQFVENNDTTFLTGKFLFKGYGSLLIGIWTLIGFVLSLIMMLISIYYSDYLGVLSATILFSFLLFVRIIFNFFTSYRKRDILLLMRMMSTVCRKKYKNSN